MQVVDVKRALFPHVPHKIWWWQHRVGSIARRIPAPRPSGRATRVQICSRQICPTLGTNLNPQGDVMHPAVSLPLQADP